MVGVRAVVAGVDRPGGLAVAIGRPAFICTIFSCNPNTNSLERKRATDVTSSIDQHL